MQVIFYVFRQRSDSARGGMFTLKMLINWRVMPIVVPLYSQPKISNSIQPNSSKSSKNLRYHHSDKNQTISIKVSNHTSSKIPAKTNKSPNLTNPTLRNPNKILNKLRLSLKYTK